ncbi:MAG: hypothetical protein KDC57_12345 [Saprospiraceae bacterium]|nr:hypothetical protein [Saprospiraceae bacterium]
MRGIRYLSALWIVLVLTGCSQTSSSGDTGDVPVDLPALLNTIYRGNKSRTVTKTLHYSGQSPETQTIDSADFHQDLKFLESFALNDRSFADQFQQTGTHPARYQAKSKKPYVRSVTIWPGGTEIPDSVHITYAMHQITGTRHMELILKPAGSFRLRVREDNRIQKNLDFEVKEVWTP